MTEEQQVVVKQLQLTSDLFFGEVLKDTQACEEVISILLDRDVHVLEVQEQYAIRQLKNHSVALDILAVEESGTRINVEMHPQSGENRLKRVRYNISSIDVESLKKSEQYANIPDIIAIYITKGDFLKTRKGINHIKRIVDGTVCQAPNGTHEYYINLNYEGDTLAQTALMRYLVDSDGIKESKYFPNLVKRVRWIKEEQGGNEYMCEIMDALMKESEERGRVEGELAGIKKGKVYGAIELLTALGYKTDQICMHLMTQFELPEESARKYLGHK